MTGTRQQARQAARETQAGAPASAEFLELVAGAVAVAVQRAMQDVQTLPGCCVCVHDAKVREQIALKALEPFEPLIRQSITVLPGRGPVCWEHAEQPELIIRAPEMSDEDAGRFRERFATELKSSAALAARNPNMHKV